jgi:hypothetical protein
VQLCNLSDPQACTLSNTTRGVQGKDNTTLSTAYKTAGFVGPIFRYRQKPRFLIDSVLYIMGVWNYLTSNSTQGLLNSSFLAPRKY